MNYHEIGESIDSGKRFDRSSWIILSIGFMMLLLGLIITAAAYRPLADVWAVDRWFFRNYRNRAYLAGLSVANSRLRQ